jgi:hypothetical protein
MDLIKANICIKQVKELIEKYSMNMNRSETLRNSMINAYENITAENACELLESFTKHIISEESAANWAFKIFMLKCGVAVIFCGATIALAGYLSKKNTVTQIGGGIALLGVCGIMSIGH